MKRVLITGISGFIGANLTRRLLAEGHEVHGIVRDDGPRWRLDSIRADVHLHVVALADAVQVRQAIEQARPDWVFHLATYGGNARESDPVQMIQAQVLGTAHVLEASAQLGVEGVVNAGSSLEYGPKDHAPAEGEPTSPTTLYGLNKAWASAYAREVARRSRLSVSTLRLYSVYGPWEDPRRLIPVLIRHAATGHLPPLADPSAAHDFIHVDDVVEALLLPVLRPPATRGSIWNIGTGRQTTLLALVELARRLFGVHESPAWGSHPGSPWDSRTWVADPSAFAREFGFRARIALDEGLRSTARWFADHSRVWSRAGSGAGPAL